MQKERRDRSDRRDKRVRENLIDSIKKGNDLIDRKKKRKQKQEVETETETEPKMKIGYYATVEASSKTRMEKDSNKCQGWKSFRKDQKGRGTILGKVGSRPMSCQCRRRRRRRSLVFFFGNFIGRGRLNENSDIG